MARTSKPGIEGYRGAALGLVQGTMACVQGVARRRLGTACFIVVSLLASTSAWVTMAAERPADQSLRAAPTAPTAPAPYEIDLAPPRTSILADAETVLVGPTVGLPEDRAPFRWGWLAARPHLSYRLTYGNGILRRQGESEDTLLQVITPGVLFEMGDQWWLDYSPSIRIYSSDQFRDSFDHNVRLSGSVPYHRWVFGLSQTYSTSSSPLIETARQTDQEQFGTALSATLQYSEKSSFSLSASQSLRSSEPFSDSKSWSGTAGWNYRVTDRTSFGLSGTGGYTRQTPGTDMTFEQLQAHLNWAPTEKIWVNLSGGGESRQFVGSDAPSLWNPIYEGALRYRPFEATTVSLQGSRRVSASLFASQLTESTEVSGGVEQRFLGKVYGDVRIGWRESEFQAAEEGLAVDRTDEYQFLRTGLRVRFLERGQVLAFYEISENDSSGRGFGFDSRQVGLQLSWAY